jgi:hypothetical protein
LHRANQRFPQEKHVFDVTYYAELGQYNRRCALDSSFKNIRVEPDDKADKLPIAMSLSKREFKTGGLAISFDPATVGAALHDECPEVDFAILMGSGRDGKIPPGGDLDLAVGLRGRLSFDLYQRIVQVVGRFVPGIDIDLGHFDRAEPVYRFEALKGRLLFTRDQERFLSAFSLACREYESQMHDYERQASYRLQRKPVAAGSWEIMKDKV